ncbi:MAG: LuxR family transcriptional regulator [Burkholderiales bacterium]
MSAWWFKRILAAGSLAQLKASVEAIIEQIGFRYFIYRGRFPRLRSGAHDICLDNCPRAWSDYYRERGLDARSDPLLQRAFREVTPILWREVAPRNPELFAKAREFGLATGVTHPVHGPDGQWSSVSFVKNRGGPQAEREIQLALANCQLLTVYFHDTVARIIKRRLDATIPVQQPGLPDSGLSDRERECLVWSAAGKTTSEIAALLAVSERTVIFHLANARHKLGAANSRHAITKAISLGLIAAG